MEPQTMRVGDFSEILGALVKEDKYCHLASITRKLTVCGKTPSDFIMGYEFFLDCPNCLGEIQWRDDHPEDRSKPFGNVTNPVATKEAESENKN